MSNSCLSCFLLIFISQRGHTIGEGGKGFEGKLRVNTNLCRPDRLKDGDFVLIEAKLCLKKFKAYGAVA